jgi:hypothetical protein
VVLLMVLCVSRSLREVSTPKYVVLRVIFLIAVCLVQI